MKLCDTCVYRDNTEYFKPCIIYRDDCELYEKKRDDMKAIIQIDVPNYQIGQEVSIYFKDTMMIKGIVQELGDYLISRQAVLKIIDGWYEQNRGRFLRDKYGDCLVCNKGALDISADDYCSKAERKRDENA